MFLYVHVNVYEKWALKILTFFLKALSIRCDSWAVFWKSGRCCCIQWRALKTPKCSSLQICLPSPAPTTTAPLSPRKPLGNANLLVLLLRLKPLSDSLPWHVCSAFLLQPCLLSLSPSPSCSDTEFLCAVFFCVLCLFHMLPALSGMPPESPLPHGPALDLSLQETLDSQLIRSPLCPCIVLFMRSVCLGLSSLSDFELQVFYSYCILLTGTVLNSVDNHRKQNKIPSLVEFLLPKGGRQ